ncbi:Aspartyl/glutamyl-tRNA(Asn/Gln) amidotransferase subunit B [uncultured archaeon]|nr:Aspartyl/glutamyl-tRNA(Asn/Gln) amidotransferase subunit B [uncultured archaeon]
MDEEKVSVTIGVEVHVPLKTQQKLFCSCPTNYYELETPNVNVCPVCTGMPGSKPYPINESAIETVVMIAELLNCEIEKENIFIKRKHYNYPDLPSGYQRTSEPIGKKGKLNGIGLWEVHIEEDPGRYDLDSGRVDYNRSGCPLIEIVSAPEMHSPEEMRNFLKELTNLLKYTGRVADVGGIMRADVNISIEGGSKVEIKNINSVHGAYKAVLYEIVRQKSLMKRGIAVKQETRGFNEKSLITQSQRLKESAADYRYIPDPDIPPQKFEEKFIASIELPETPQRLKDRIIATYKVEPKYADTLVRNKPLADAFLTVAAEKGIDSALAAKWLCEEVTAQINFRGVEYDETKLSNKILVSWLRLIEHKKVTDIVAKKLLERFIDSGEDPTEIVKKEGLAVVADTSALAQVVEAVLKENSQAAADLKSGNTKSMNFLMGKVMKQMRGAADADTTRKLIDEKTR